VATHWHGAMARRVLRITYHSRARPAHAVTPSKAGRARTRPHMLFGVAIGATAGGRSYR
jgi:hypothetical protein